jgi:predicted CopG family antitoxin
MYTYVYVVDMAKQIAVSDEVYNMLLSMKDETKSFSEVIKSMAAKKKSGKGIMKYAGILKGDSKELDKVEKMVLEDRRRNYGRVFE